MDHSNFITYITNRLKITAGEVFAIRQDCLIRAFGKDEFILRAGEHSKFILFVEEGLLKQYSIDGKGKEHVLHFAAENSFVANHESLFHDKPSPYFIQALEPTVVSLLDDTFIKKFEQEVPVFRDFNQLLLHDQISILQNRVTMLMSQTAQERYLQFVATYPDIMRRVPQALVASYLGITPESLSRVRKELAESRRG